MYLKYFKSLMTHKWFVFLECCKLGIPWLGIIHDWSKFLPSEWIPYARYFHGGWPEGPEVWRSCPSYTGPTKSSVQSDFDEAWLHHQNYNKHHWQYYLLVQDDDPDKVLPMPDRYRREMLADWRGAGRAYTGKDNTREWYLERADQWDRRLHPQTKAWIEFELGL